MDRNLRAPGARLTSALHARIPKRPGSHSTLSKGLTALLTLGLAWAADQTSRRSAIHHWLNQNPPSEALQKRLLETYGFRMEFDPVWIERHWRTLPSTAANDPQVWYAPEHGAVLFYALSPAEDAPSDSLFEPRFARVSLGASESKKPKGPTRSDWRYLGTSWQGLAHLAQKLDERPQAPPAPLRKPRPTGDSRQIHF